MSGEFIIKAFDECCINDWDEFALECDEAWFWHTSMFLSAWPYGKNVSFCIVLDGKIILEQTLFFYGNIRKKSFHLKKWHQIPYLTNKIDNDNEFSSIGGLARKYHLSKKRERKLQITYLTHLKELIDSYQVGNFSYCIEATCPKAFWPDKCPLINPLIFWGYINKMSQAYVIDLEQSEGDIFKAYNQTTRNLIYKNEKNSNIRIVEANPTQDDLDKYYSLHCETYTRTGVSPHPKKYFEKIFFDILPAGLCHILFLYEGDKLLVAHNTLLYKEAAMYWTGCSVSDKGDGETRLLMHKQIMFAKSRGCRYFEVGECFPNVFEGKIKGLNDFKKSFGGMIHPIFRGAFPVPKE